MASRFHVLAVATLLLALLTASTARADTIVVSAGAATVAWDDPPFFDLMGDGFHLFSGFFSVPASPQDACFDGCVPGEVVNLGTVMGGAPTFDLGQAQIAVVNGVTYASQSEPGTWLSLTGEFSFSVGEVTIPPLSTGDDLALFLTAPFAFMGSVAGFPQDQTGAASLFDVDLEGSGTATLRLINTGDRWRFPEVRFAFDDSAPVPEPASFLLVGGGVAGLAVRHQRRPDAGSPRGREALRGPRRMTDPPEGGRHAPSGPISSG